VGNDELAPVREQVSEQLSRLAQGRPGETDARFLRVNGQVVPSYRVLLLVWQNAFPIRFLPSACAPVHDLRSPMSRVSNSTRQRKSSGSQWAVAPRKSSARRAADLLMTARPAAVTFSRQDRPSSGSLIFMT
jgi:hypothetical protein